MSGKPCKVVGTDPCVDASQDVRTLPVPPDHPLHGLAMTPGCGDWLDQPLVPLDDDYLDSLTLIVVQA